MKSVKRKYIIKSALHECILSKNEHGSYNLRSIEVLYDESILFFESKEDAEKYIIENNTTGVTIVEVFV